MSRPQWNLERVVNEESWRDPERVTTQRRTVAMQFSDLAEDPHVSPRLIGPLDTRQQDRAREGTCVFPEDDSHGSSCCKRFTSSCRVRDVRIALVILTSACCHASPPAAPPAAQQSLKATLNGERLTFASAITRSRADGRVEVIASTHALTCETVDELPARGDVRFKLVLVPKLYPDGHRGWRVEGKEFENASSTTNDSEPVEARIDTKPGGASRISVTNSGTLAMDSFEKSRKLIVWGELEAIGCGADQRFTWKAPSAQPATIDVAGNSFPIAGAAISAAKSDQRYRVMLGTEAVDCSASGEMVMMTSVGDITLELEIQAKRPMVASLEGDLIGVRGGTYQSEVNGLSLTGLPFEGSPDVVELVLGGKAVVASIERGAGYPIALHGKVRATVCHAPAASK